MEKFNSLTQDKSETYSQFSTRLMSLFDYYVESRKVSQSYDKLIDLIVYDRVKSCLSPALSHYVLSLEANHKDGWVGLAARGWLRLWTHIWQIYQRLSVDLVLFLGTWAPGQNRK